MTRKAYMKKWRGLTDDEVQEELQQIALERQLLEDSAMPGADAPPYGVSTNVDKGIEAEEEELINEE